jgi:hypothetical protein
MLAFSSTGTAVCQRKHTPFLCTGNCVIVVVIIVLWWSVEGGQLGLFKQLSMKKMQDLLSVPTNTNYFNE